MGRGKHGHKEVTVSRQCSLKTLDTLEGLQNGLGEWSRDQGGKSEKRLPSCIGRVQTMVLL